MPGVDGGGSDDGGKSLAAAVEVNGHNALYDGEAGRKYRHQIAASSAMALKKSPRFNLEPFTSSHESNGNS